MGDKCNAKQKLTPGVCEFVPDENQPEADLGSILYTSHVGAVSEYCDNNPGTRNEIVFDFNFIFR